MARNSDLADRLVRLDRTDHDVATAYVCGELDFWVTPAVRRRLLDASGPLTPVLVVDLDGVTLLSAAAIEMMLDVVRLAGDRSTEVRYVAGCRAVLRPLAITGDRAHLPLFPSQAAARGA